MDMEDPQGEARTCLFRCAWHWSNRFPDVFCILQSVTQMLFWGHAVISSILFNNLLVPWREKCVCVCLCVCFWGAPWGEAGQSLPVAALGQGMAIQDTCLATGPNIIVAPFVFVPTLDTFPSPAMYSDPHFNLSVPQSPFWLSFAYLFLQLVLANCTCLS